MCNFFSFCTMPDSTSDFYYFDWQMRQADKDGADSHSHICARFGIDEDKCNKYEFNPLTGVFTVDMQNAEKDDKARAEKWVKQLDFKTVIEPLIIKPIVNPFELPKVEIPTDEQINWLIEWASVRTSVGDSVWDSVGTSVGDSVWDSVGAYISSFFAVEYNHDLSSAIKLWESGLVPSFDGTTWRLHSGKNEEIVYGWKPK